MPETEKIDFGAILRVARETRGVSLRDIANSRKLPMPALEALEHNDVSKLPGGIFTRSIVRSYAEEVGLDPEDTLREFLVHFQTDNDEDVNPYANESEEDELFLSQQRMADTVLRLVMVSVPVAGLLFFFGLGAGDETPVVPAITELATAEEMVLPDGVPESQPPRVVPEVSSVETVGLVGPLTIDIHPSGACWVALTVDGERIFSRVMQSGERVVREAVGEIIVNVGDAGAFKFAINQQAGRQLGGSGEVVTARINHANYRSFVTQQ